MRRSSFRGTYNIPNYDGMGWTPLANMFPEYIDCWYPAWSIGGRASGDDNSALIWKDMGYWRQDLTATYGSNAPVVSRYQTILNGRLCVSFGAAQRLLGDGVKNGAPTGAQKTIITVVNVASGDQWAFSKGNSDSNEEWAQAFLSGTNYYDSGGTNAYCQGGSYSTGTNLVVTSKNTSGTHIMRINGTQVISQTRSVGISSSTGGICIGMGRNGSVGSFNGSYIAEAVAYRAPLDDSTIQIIERKFGAYYGCAVA